MTDETGAENSETTSSLLTLGAGNMASALLSPMRSSLGDFFTYTPSHVRAVELAKNLKGQALTLEECATIEAPDFLFLSFKPQVYKEATSAFLKSIPWEKWRSKTTIVSLLAGTPIEVISRDWQSERVVRIMPNTPATVGEGITLVSGSSYMMGEGLAYLKLLESLLKNAGRVYICKDEDQLNDITAVTGSGPAYIFEITRIMQDFLLSKGVDEKSARRLSVGLLKGASEMMDQSLLDLNTLRENVTSKKGVTLAALESLWQDDLEGVFVKALEKNISRSQELRNEALQVN